MSKTQKSGDTLTDYLQLSAAITANLAELSPAAVEWYLTCKDQIPGALTRGFQIIYGCVNMFGAEHVITAKQAASVWNLEIPAKPAIHYAAKDLHQAAMENRAKKADWHLVYCHGLSLREQQERLGIDKNSKPYFFPDLSDIDANTDRWVTDKPPAGYYLLDFSGKFPNMSWYDQRNAIDKLDGMERAHEAVVAEAMASILKVHNQQPFKNWHHWGRYRTSANCYIQIRCDNNCIKVDGFGCLSKNDHRDSFRVVLAQKFTK